MKSQGASSPPNGGGKGRGALRRAKERAWAFQRPLEVPEERAWAFRRPLEVPEWLWITRKGRMAMAAFEASERWRKGTVGT